jgi:Xaa-Pro aminopeptidase
VSDQEVRERLLWAQGCADELFGLAIDRGLVRPGVTERAASDAVRDLAAELFGVEKHWHKRIVRAGPNALEPYDENPPDRVIDEDDLVFLDLGPVFDQWEADVGRSYVFGDDPDKHRLCADLPEVFAAGRAHFEAVPEITGAQLYAYVVGLAEERGWQFGGPIAGHLVGHFPHERIAGDKTTLYIAPGSDLPLRTADRHWILEVHLVDRARGFGGFYEQLLDV